MSPRQATLLPSEWAELDAPEPRKVDGPEELFASQCRQFQLPPFERQVLFAKQLLGRRWAFDFAFRGYLVAVEIDGVAVKRLGGRLVVLGRHASIEGIRGDNEKLNAAALLGWTVLRFLQTDVKPRHAIETTMRVLAARGWNQTPESSR